ncbi:glycosyltransferase family 4 protein [Pelomonas sp. SE-A7]|uniref:glycosyltransferase family 4 protein n=1 Tax=Pelomonas sp. SE-A7 TaxID=3054953 RepID=UPI00259C82AD|nr:glycosyltransferase family 4 protein [Pelomonas sp. SE-A7]MDM4767558.1 glycosyltransferase family 4 protein [Pelomonas sp. SE-A7]
MKQKKLVLIGDGQSPHLVKWARALAPEVQLWAASSRGFTPEFEALVPAERRHAMSTDPLHAGGNVAVLAKLPALGRWLAKIDADWLHAHYLTSHGTLAWAARRGWGLRARIAGSAWGTDILVTPEQGAAYRWLTRRVLRACDVCTSDSLYMARRMQELGAGEVMTFPFGLESLPKQGAKKQPWLFFANRGLEPIYAPHRVITAFANVAAVQAEARLVVANEGSLRPALEQQVRQLGLDGRVEFVGRLDAKAQAGHYARARWYLSLPGSDSVSVSVLEAMAHECIPILSELPANRELVGAGAGQGLILRDDEALPTLLADMGDTEAAGRANRAWVAEHGLFAPAVERFLARLQEIDDMKGAGR